MSASLRRTEPSMAERPESLPMRPPSYDKKIGLVLQGVLNAFRDKHEVRHAINELHKLLPPELLSTEQAKRLYEHGCVTEMDIVQLIYHPVEPQGAWKDYAFSRASMERLWQQGTFDARSVLHASPWLAPMPKELGVRVFDVM
jgi:NTE family protein